MDLMQSEYAWATDEVLLEMPICRARQKIELIQQRLDAKAKLNTQIVQWQTRNICGTLAGLAQDESVSKAINKNVESMTLDLFGDESDTTSVVNDTRSIDEIMEQGAQIDLDTAPSFDAVFAAMNQVKDLDRRDSPNA